MNRYGNGSLAAVLAGLSGIASRCAASPAAAQTLKAVKDRGALNCGVSEGLYGFSARDDKGAWSGFDVDLCRAIAAAIFNDAEQGQITFRSMPAAGSARCNRGNIDVLSRNTTWTMSRETELGLNLRGDHLLRRPGIPGPASAEQGFGARARRREGVRADRHHHRAQSRRSFPHQQDEVSRRSRSQTADEAIKGYDSGRCNVFTADVSQLHADPASAGQARRSRHSAGRHLQGAARTGGAPGRRAMVQHRASGCTSR